MTDVAVVRVGVEVLSVSAEFLEIMVIVSAIGEAHKRVLQHLGVWTDRALLWLNREAHTGYAWAEVIHFPELLGGA
ncbi:MAG TPA: hypothetical protein VJ874_01140 [Candidatus Thermoplasmatota archaeon]|nr:hypothetical protein [Candidatus Thermoplasmatota archaeon]